MCVFVFSYSMAADSSSSQHCQSIICHEKRLHIRKKAFIRQGMLTGFFPACGLLRYGFAFVVFVGFLSRFIY